jgi:hypothetical protein
MMERMSEALERIATALERTADADPLAMFNAAFADGSDPFAERSDPQPPIASNGQTMIYALPDQHYQIVARKDRDEESGYSVTIEGVDE